MNDKEFIIVFVCVILSGISIGFMIGMGIPHNKISICDKCKIVYDTADMKYCTECGGKVINTKEYEWKDK